MPQWTQEAMTKRLVRYGDLIACPATSFDTPTPTTFESEEFLIIGPGAPDRHAHIGEPHGFRVGALRRSFGCVHSQYSRDTAEVFVVHSGHWRLFFGPNQEDGSIDLAPGDVISVPCHVFRGAAKLDEGRGFFWTPLGKAESNNLAWSPARCEVEGDQTLRLAMGGKRIDTSCGIYQLRNMESEAPSMTIAPPYTPTVETLQSCCVRAEAMVANPHSPLAADGVAEAGVIAAQRTGDGFLPGPITDWWPHGFNLRRLTLASGAYVPLHARQEAEVLFMQQGTLEVSWNDGAVIMGAGDTLSVPVGLPHAFRNAASVAADVFIVRGTEDPAMPVFSSSPVVQDRASAPMLL